MKHSRVIPIALFATVVIGGVIALSLVWRRTSDADRARSLVQDSFPVRSIAPTDEDFSDLEPLIEHIGDRRFVFMTEATHSSGGTFAARQRLIRFLHQKLGFDVIAMETAFFQMERINQQLSDPAEFLAINPVGQNLHPFHTHRPLFEYVHKTRLQDVRPIQVLGLHPLYLASDQVVLTLKEFFATAGVAALPEAHWQALNSILNPYLSYTKEPIQAELRQLQEFTHALQSMIENNRDLLLDAHGTDRVCVIQSVCASLPVFIAHQAPGGILHLRDHRQQLELRDEAMARFVLDAALKRYPQRKIIVTGATYHLVQQANLLDIRSMADFLHKKLTGQIYTIVFAPYSGRHGTTPPGIPISNALPGTLVELMHRAGDPYRFLDLRNLPSNHWLRHERVDGHMNFTNTAVLWPELCDGVFFIERELPLGTPIENDQATE